jgi:NAD(P)-dependent dehydrogenase (short-subunit alcohol dehydrogenase family)
MSKLSNKTAVITGGSSGIGLAVAQEFTAQGATVMITGRDQARLTEAAQVNNIAAVQADVRDIVALERVFGQVKAEHGGLDILFVNAGIARMGPIEAMTEDVFDEVMSINFKGAYFTIQKALPIMREGGTIILNGSVNALVGFANASVYSASKAALHSLARTLSAELAERKIRVNTLNIGPVNTPLHGKLGLPQAAAEQFAGAVIEKIVLKRFGTPEEIAKAAVFLASDDSSFVVGSELATDGGMLINGL